MKLHYAHLVLILGLVGSAFGRPAGALQQTVKFRNLTLESTFPEGIAFRVEICGRQAGSTVLFNFRTAQDWDWHKETRMDPEGRTSDGCDKRKYFLQTRPLGIPPFSRINYFWSVVQGSQFIARSPEHSYRYEDDRYTWKTMEDQKLVVLWHDRPASFGAEVKYIAAYAYDQQAGFYSATLAEPITVVISNTSEEFFSWQEEEHYAGGLSYPELYLTVQLVEDLDDYYNWISEVLPHEISHIYFNHLIKRYSGASEWLDEGVASYSEYSDHLDDWDLVQMAHENGQLLPLKDLEYDFGEEPDRIDLAYAESYYTVLYMDEFYGKDAIATLLYEYSKGTGATAAFQKSFGKDPQKFESEFVSWLDERVKTPPPNTRIPKPIPTSTNDDQDSRKMDTAVSPSLEGLLFWLLGLFFVWVILRPGRSSQGRR